MLFVNIQLRKSLPSMERWFQPHPGSYRPQRGLWAEEMRIAHRCVCACVLSAMPATTYGDLAEGPPLQLPFAHHLFS